jgi:hypothetical protein
MVMPTQPWHRALAEHIAEHMKGLKDTEVDGWTIKVKDVAIGAKVSHEGTPRIFVYIETEDGEGWVEFEMRDENGPLY